MFIAPFRHQSACIPVIAGDANPLPCALLSLSGHLADLYPSAQASEIDCRTLAGHLLSQWPVREATIKGLPDLPLLDVQAALLSVMPEWERLSDNHQLSKHLIEVQNLLNLYKSPARLEKHSEEDDDRGWYPFWKTAGIRPSIHDLLYQPLDELLTNENGNVGPKETFRQVHSASKLHTIISSSESPSGRRHFRYVFSISIERGKGIASRFDYLCIRSFAGMELATSNSRANLSITADQPVPHDTFPGTLRQPSKPTSKEPSLISELGVIISHFSKSEDSVRSAYGKSDRCCMRSRISRLDSACWIVCLDLSDIAC